MVETAEQVAAAVVLLLLAGNVLVVSGAALVEFAPRSSTSRVRALARLLSRATSFSKVAAPR